MLAAISGCSTSPVENIEKLPAPLLLPAPPDTALIEQGIDAVESGDFIQLDWRAGDEREPFRYRIYRGLSTDDEYTLIAEVGGKIETYIDSVGVIGTRYYYYVTAKDEDEGESEPSDTLSYQLLAKPVLLANTSSVRPTFSWQVNGTPPQFYVLKLLETDTDKKIWVTWVQTSFGDQMEQVKYNFDSTAVRDSLRTGVSYKWRVDIVGPSANSGSESNWKRFVLQ